VETLAEMLSLRMDHLWDRVGGPLSFRMLVMPIAVSFFGIRAGLRDARAGRATFLYGLLRIPEKRALYLRSAVGDIGKVFIVALVLDSVYQLIILRAIFLGELLFMAVTFAVVPYCLVRGPVTLFAQRYTLARTQSKHEEATHPKKRM
jgi:hypothetical protein